MYDEIINPLPNVNSCPVEVWEWISTLLGMILLIYAGIKRIPY